MIKMFQKKRVELGDGHIIQYCIFECKYLFSIILYNWKTIKQNRFHSHAFSAIAFLLSGAYEQEVYKNGQIRTEKVNNWLTPRYLPKNYTHRIMKAESRTWTIVFTGPWMKYWYEWFEDTNTWVKYTWGRKVLGKSNVPPEEL